jgi:UDP-N-acetylglucosamine 1-carboxyvinyltransferase
MSEQLKKQISQLIREARIERGLTQRELGEKIGVSESAVNRYESGNLNMSTEVLYKIAEAMNLDLSVNFNKR